MHGGHMGMGNAFGSGSYGMGWCRPPLDEALAALITDLVERGLLERTLIVVVGEFGRSPRINTQGQPGRVHWPDCFSAILAGGGIRGGAVVGASDRIGAYVRDRPVRPQDLGATIYHALEVPLDTRLGRGDGVRAPSPRASRSGSCSARAGCKQSERQAGSLPLRLLTDRSK